MEIDEIKRYITYDEAIDIIGISSRTVRKFKKEMEDNKLIGTRYPKEAVISCGRIVRIWFPVLVDYMNNRYRLLDTNMRKYVEPYGGKSKGGLMC
jgi:hypothetical protein